MEKQLTIDSEFVGIPWKKTHKTITWRDTTNFAAAIGDMNPLYFDDERAEGIIATPMFAVCFGWFLGRQHIRELIDVPYTDEILDRDVHYTEFIEFHRPIRPGDGKTTFTVQPSIDAMIAHRGGTNVVYKYEVRDEQGSLYHTEYNGTMLRGVTCVDGGKGVLPYAPSLPENCGVLWEKRLHIPPEWLYFYDAVTGEGFPIHTSRKFAHSVDLPDILVQGVLTMALAVKELTNLELGGDGLRLKAVGARFTAMVFADTDITIQLMHKEETEDFVELFYQVFNQDGKVAVNNGYIKAARSTK